MLLKPTRDQNKNNNIDLSLMSLAEDIHITNNVKLIHQPFVEYTSTCLFPEIHIPNM